MATLKELYAALKSLRDLKLPIDEGLLNAADELEESIIEEQILPVLSQKIEPLLSEIQRDLVLVVEYHPGEPISVAISRKAKISEIKDAKPLKPKKAGEIKPHGTTSPTKYKETPAEVVFEHVLDYSFYNYGCTIDKQFHQPIFEVLGGRLERGQRKDIVLRYEGKEFAAQIENVDRQGVKSDTIRCMWKGKASSKLSTYLQQQFADDFKAISDLHEAHINKLPDNLRRFALFYNPEDGVFEMRVK